MRTTASRNGSSPVPRAPDAVSLWKTWVVSEPGSRRGALTHATGSRVGASDKLYDFITYKATLAGVAIVTIDPRNTSRTCAACGHCSKSNRKSQSEFVCKACGHRAHADVNAARNHRARALTKQALE